MFAQKLIVCLIVLFLSVCSAYYVTQVALPATPGEYNQRQCANRCEAAFQGDFSGFVSCAAQCQ